jgi:TRAP-type mannitol/chloroaromatic compound transport system permease small subunit
MAVAQESTASISDVATFWVRVFSWCLIAVLAVFLANNYLVTTRDWPGVVGILLPENAGPLAWIQLAAYFAGFAAAAIYVWSSRAQTLRADSALISDANIFLVRACFWAVLLIGLVDMVVSFLRVEGLLIGVVGEEMTKKLGRPQFRGTYLHMPLMGVGLVIAAFTRTLGFIWLTLLIVAAELSIVITRFVFSYEQAFMGDLVRFWYGALFLFASAYTLLEEGHVRVDVFYSTFKTKRKGLVNAVGSIVLGLSMSWTIMIVGMGHKRAIINMPVVNFEVSQSGYGMYVKYLMAAFLGVFAVTMAVQFVSYFLESVADYRGEPGKRKPASSTHSELLETTDSAAA